MPKDRIKNLMEKYKPNWSSKYARNSHESPKPQVLSLIIGTPGIKECNRNFEWICNIMIAN
jgi:hypothetical protein